MPKPYPREFRDDVVRVARNREPGVTVEQIATDFGVHPMTLWKWLQRAAVDDGSRPGLSKEKHLADAVAALEVVLSDDEVAALEAPYVAQSPYWY